MRFRSKERATSVRDGAKNGAFFGSRLISRAIKPKIPFHGLFLLRNQTETFATQAKCLVELRNGGKVDAFITGSFSLTDVLCYRYRFMYWFGVLRSEGRIYKLPMYETEYPYDAIAIDLPKPSQFAIDYFDRKLYWTGGNYRRSSATGIKSHKLDLDDTIDGQRTEVSTTGRKNGFNDICLRDKSKTFQG